MNHQNIARNIARPKEVDGVCLWCDSSVIDYNIIKSGLSMSAHYKQLDEMMQNLVDK